MIDDRPVGADGVRESGRQADRGLSTIIALVTAITVLTIAVAGTMVIVEDAFRGTERGDAERAVAVGASERLVAADGPAATAPNVLDDAALANLTAADLRAAGASDRFALAVAVDGDRVAAVGEPQGGTTIRRIVMVRTAERVERTPSVVGGADPSLTLPVRTRSVELTLDPPPGTNVTAVRSGDRVVLLDGAGLSGTYRIETSPYRTLALDFETDGPLATGNVTVAYRSTNRERAILRVHADDTGTNGGAAP